MATYNNEHDIIYWQQVAPGRLIVFFLLFFLIGEGLRQFARSSVIRRHQPVVLDLAATLTLYGCTIGCNYVHRIYGPLAYLIVTAAVGICHAAILSPGVTGNLIAHISSDIPLQPFLLRLAVHAAGGLVSHALATILWASLMADLIGEGLGYQMNCLGYEGHDHSVHVAIVLGMEFIGALVASFLMLKSGQLSIGVYETTAKVFFCCVLHSAGKKIPGIYLNPVMSTSQLIGCSEQSLLQHVLIYWVAPMISASVVVFYYSRNQQVQPTPTPSPLQRPKIMKGPRSTVAGQSTRPAADDKMNLQPDPPSNMTSHLSTMHKADVIPRHKPSASVSRSAGKRKGKKLETIEEVKESC